MKLTVDYDFGNALGPGWVMSFGINGKIAAMFYDHEPTIKEVVDFVNECGKQLDGVEKAA